MQAPNASSAASTAAGPAHARSRRRRPRRKPLVAAPAALRPGSSPSRWDWFSEIVFIVDQEREPGKLGDLDPLRRILLPIVSIEEDILVVGDVEDGPGEIPFSLAAPIHGFDVPAEI